MTVPARLVALRLQGFKSFADRTVVEFGPGINAVIGPNGSGKSNLADALRWALGEQGRALRSRKSEDVVFAGSDRRSAVGMADVTLVLDNADGLLPIDYGTVELGRRLFRSGENDYLLNRQRVRLRDLEDLLEGAHLAENAFLFIGQGMVDQALALRPEERRPLFEEVAGVRRHDRRRRRAEEQLTEAEANLARVEDLLAELRPQARRLAAQAEQQASRERAGDELAHALLASAHLRWHEAAARAGTAADELARTRAEVDAALSALLAAEGETTAVALELAARAEAEAERRLVHDRARAGAAEIRLRLVTLDATAVAVARDRERIDAERTAADRSLAEGRRALALPTPERDLEAEAELAGLDRARAEAVAELSALQTARRAEGEAAAATRRAEEARRGEREAGERRAMEAERRAAEALAEAVAAASSVATLREATAAAHAAVAETGRAESEAAAAREAARGSVEVADGARSAAAEAAAAAREQAAGLRARLGSLRTRLQDEERRGIARAARRVGGRALAEGLEVDPRLRTAVTAALGEAERAFVVEQSAVAELGGERGVLVVEAESDAARPRASASAATERIAGAERIARDRALALGGGALGDAVRSDPTGRAAALLARALWVPDLEAALRICPDLPVGWVVATRNGALVGATGVIVLGRRESLLEQRAEVDRIGADEARATDVAAAADRATVEAETAVAEARRRLDVARATESVAIAARRRADEEERSASRELERAVREEAWSEAQAERLGADAHRERGQADALAALGDGWAGVRSAPVTHDGPGDEAVASWEGRLSELVVRRERVAATVGERDRARRDAEHRRARAEAGVALDEDRLARADREAASLVARSTAAEREREQLAADAVIADEAEERARAALDETRTSDSALRVRLAAAESEAVRSRARLRAAEDRHRRLEVGDLEARMALDAVREQLLVELAALGEVGVHALSAAAGETAGEVAGSADLPAATEAVGLGDPARDEDDLDVAIAALLPRAAERWAAVEPAADVPSPGRLASLRRRFHDVGAANPFAAEEYAAVHARLEALEAQSADLRVAIEKTRTLIGELATLIADRFRATFRRLEGAFDARFRQLFGGGYAQLSLTDPGDLASTGVEIVARPPGKKAQALAMLSGGERALTAVALLFAMLEVRPVPFCVLDEVDAALDEANIGRFAEALAGLAASIQFIVITHNRGTIEAADALYGITIGDDAVSRVISLRLEEAREIADASRPVGREG